MEKERKKDSGGRKKERIEGKKQRRKEGRGKKRNLSKQNRRSDPESILEDSEPQLGSTLFSA